MEFINKLKWVLTLLLIFGLILATNIIDRNNFRKIKSSVVTIYEDRVVAKNLILEYLALVHEKELAVATSDEHFFSQRNNAVNQAITDITERYQATKLTKEEAIAFKELQGNLNKLVTLEASIDINEPSEQYGHLLDESKANLKELSEIQLEESRNQMALSKNIFKEVESFTRIENYCLIALAILIPIIIFGSSRSLKQIFG
jgi:hypothetical protein